jgi:DNA-binding NtrC family response regulator
MNLPDDDESDMIYDRQNGLCSILVANADKQISEKLSALLDRMGYDVVVSDSGDKALDLFLKKSFAIVFTVLKMPGMDGLTLSLQVKATSLNTPVVLILDENLENIMNRIKAGRVDCVMLKPLGSGEIQKIVQYFVTKRSRVQPALASGS